MRWHVGSGLDLGLRSDSSGGCIVLGSSTKDPVFYVASIFERRPQKGAPLVPSVVVGEFCHEVRRYGGKSFAVDQFYVESVREHAMAAHMTLHEAPGGAGGKLLLHTRARELIHSNRVRFAPGHKRLVQQLREIMSVALPGGAMRISSPRRRGSHGDLASAFILALWRADMAARRSSAGPSYIVGSARSANPGVRVGRTRRRPEPPPGALDVSGTKFCFYTDPETGERKVIY